MSFLWYPAQAEVVRKDTISLLFGRSVKLLKQMSAIRNNQLLRPSRLYSSIQSVAKAKSHKKPQLAAEARQGRRNVLGCSRGGWLVIVPYRF